jgi:hypothetical protein
MKNITQEAQKIFGDIVISAQSKFYSGDKDYDFEKDFAGDIISLILQDGTIIKLDGKGIKKLGTVIYNPFYSKDDEIKKER